MDVYFISGLGADRRAFEKIILTPDHTAYYIDWLEPLSQESLTAYAKRMASSIDVTKPFVLVGLSFGGIVSIEIGKVLQPKQIILISSVSHRSEMPWYFRFASIFNIHKTFFVSQIKRNEKIMFWFFGTKSNKLRAYLKEMIEAMSYNYLKWSIHEIVNWKQQSKPQNVFHIHGNADKLFPIQYIKPDKLIDRGSHFMVVTHARAISAVINELLN